jgi:hypothetical protein
VPLGIGRELLRLKVWGVRARVLAVVIVVVTVMVVMRVRRGCERCREITIVIIQSVTQIVKRREGNRGRAKKGRFR